MYISAHHIAANTLHPSQVFLFLNYAELNSLTLPGKLEAEWGPKTWGLEDSVSWGEAWSLAELYIKYVKNFAIFKCIKSIEILFLHREVTHYEIGTLIRVRFLINNVKCLWIISGYLRGLLKPALELIVDRGEDPRFSHVNDDLFVVQYAWKR